jgi:hypothetical protein
MSAPPGRCAIVRAIPDLDQDPRAPRTELPRFSLRDYGQLLDDLIAAGYALQPVEGMPNASAQRTVYLRHDIDIHISGIELLAALESERGVCASYYVPLTVHFNPHYPANRRTLRALVDAGHRIGLHYDLQTYPDAEQAAWDQLEYEVEILRRLAGVERIESISMHMPWGGREDFFRETDRYVHPHAPRYADVAYVSDSCRAWRDETLLRCFADPPVQRLLLTTHPELWLGRSDETRDAFLAGTLLENAVRQHRSYVSDHVTAAWRAHPAPPAHDTRERG